MQRTQPERMTTATLARPGPVPARTASLVALGGSLAAVTLQWLSGVDWSSAAEAVTSLGRLAGLVASDLLLVQVLLMARLPWVERAFGQDALARAHRTVGFTSFNLVLAHVTLTLLGYAALDGRDPVRETAHVVWTYPGMLLAAAALVALVLVVATSVRAARAALRYESWHLLHLYAYLGVGLALPHQLWTGGDLVANPVARWAWTTAYAGTLAAVLAYRVGRPLVDNRRWQLRVAGVRQDAPGVTTVAVTGRELPRATAGQFFVFRFRDGAGWTAGNPYSLSAAPDGRSLQLTALDRGRLARLAPGTRVYVEGPYGRLTRTTDRPLLVLANGIGVTPGLAVLQTAPHDAVLVHRGRLDLEVTAGVRVVRVEGPRARRGSWLPESAAHLSDAEALLRLVPDLARREVLVSGTAAWVEHAERACLAAGLPAAQLKAERFSW